MEVGGCGPHLRGLNRAAFHSAFLVEGKPGYTIETWGAKFRAKEVFSIPEHGVVWSVRYSEVKVDVKVGI